MLTWDTMTLHDKTVALRHDADLEFHKEIGEGSQVRFALVPIRISRLRIRRIVNMAYLTTS